MAFSKALLAPSVPLSDRLMAFSAPDFSAPSTSETWPLLRTRVAFTPVLSVALLIAAASSSMELLPSPSVSILLRSMSKDLPFWLRVRVPWVSMSPLCKPEKDSWWLLASCSTKKS